MPSHDMLGDDNIPTCTHRHTALSGVGALFSQHPEAARSHLKATRYEIPQAVPPGTSSGLRTGRFFYREGSDLVLVARD